MEQVGDTGYAPDRWAFDDEVTRVFDDMLRRSIPQYDVMRAAVFDVACNFVQPKTAIIDLGCSRGEAIAPLVDKFGCYNQFVGVEVSEPMLEACRERFAGYIAAGVVQILDLDLRETFPPVDASVIMSVLTLMFVPIEHRQRVVQRVYDHLQPGGAFVVVEKVLGSSALIDDLLVKLYYNMKRDHGYTEDDIERKRLSLEGKLVPMTRDWNVDMLRAAGFVKIDCFWRWMNFAAWVAIK